MARNAKQAARTRTERLPGKTGGGGHCGTSPELPALRHDPQARPRHVLLIEDHPAALQQLALWLAEHGFRTEEFENLEQAMLSLTERNLALLH